MLTRETRWERQWTLSSAAGRRTRSHGSISLQAAVGLKRAFRQPRERLSMLIGADISGRTSCLSPNQPHLVPDSGPTRLSVSVSAYPSNTRLKFEYFATREYMCILHIVALAMKGLLLWR